MMSLRWPWRFSLAIVLIGISVFYRAPLFRNNLVLDISEVWDKEITMPKRTPKRIMVGVNTNLDVIVSAVDILGALNVENSLPVDYSTLSSGSELGHLVSFSMQHCAAVERVFTDQHSFNDVASAATSVPHHYHIGGNAALIAEKIKSTVPSIQVMLVGPIGERLGKLLHDDIITTSTYSEASEDEIHVILEYSTGAQWGQVEATCANRVIISRDVSNSKMAALESVPDAVRTFLPDLVVLSGAHLLGGQKKEVWKQRLIDTATILETTLRRIPVHWELATIGNLDFFQQLARILFPKIESLGLNEQELLSVAESSNAPFDFNSIPAKPGIEWLSDLLHWLMQTYSSASGLPSSLTRVHLHSLSFHVIATVVGGPWTNSKEAVMAGAQVAGLQACDTHTFTSHKFKVIVPEEFYVSKTDTTLLKEVMFTAGWIKWSRDGINYDFSPVLVCENPTKTVGLGDAISALGLLYSQYNT